MFLQMQPGNKHSQVLSALRKLPQIPGQDSPPLKEKEIDQLAALKTSNGDYLFDPANDKTFYQLVSTILQLRDGEAEFTRVPGDLPVGKMPEEIGFEETSGGLGFEEAVRDLHQDWTFPEEAVHESKLLLPTRNKIQYDILKEEEEPIVEEGHIVCERPGCPSRKITRTELQTRGSDESTTKFFLCTTCGFKWTD